MMTAVLVFLSAGWLAQDKLIPLGQGVEAARQIRSQISRSGLIAPLATITVTNTNDGGPGSLRQAIADASSGDTITFAIPLPATITNSNFFALVVDKNLTIQGPGSDKLTINGSALDNVFIFNSGITATISGLTITNGNSGSGGGIVSNSTTTLTINNCVITGNTARAFGGGIINFGTLTINDSIVSNNRTTNTGNTFTRGAGINNQGSLTLNSTTVSNNVNSATAAVSTGGGIYSDHSVTINNSQITGNNSPIGGGIYIEDSGHGPAALTINTSAISGNSAGFAGAGIYFTSGGIFTIDKSSVSSNTSNRGAGGIFNDSTLTISNSTISGNTADTGGAIYNRDGYAGTVNIVNSTISGNLARLNSADADSGKGGGIYNLGGGSLAAVLLQSSTIANNSATLGGGIYMLVGNTGTGDVKLENTILKTGSSGENIFNQISISGTTGLPLSGTVTSLGYNLSNDSGGFLNALGDMQNIDPLLGSLQDNGGPTLTHALLPGSPAIDAGNPCFISPPDSDQRGPGFLRISNARVDIGSFEVQTASNPTPPCSTPTPTPTPTVTVTPTPTPIVTATPTPTPSTTPTPTPTPTVTPTVTPTPTPTPTVTPTPTPNPDVLTEINAVITTVSTSRIPSGNQNGLIVKLKAAIMAIQQHDTASACSDLQDFIDQVNALRGKKIANDLADSLISSITAVQQEIGCGAPIPFPVFQERLSSPITWISIVFSMMYGSP